MFWKILRIYKESERDFSVFGYRYKVFLESTLIEWCQDIPLFITSSLSQPQQNAGPCPYSNQNAG